MAELQHFYDGQLRRYITQLIRMMSGFTYKNSSGKVTPVPVMYGDLTRQVGSILRDNSENSILSAPRMAVYVTGLELDTARLSDASYVNKVNIRERAYDEEGNEYLDREGKNYTVERLMPTPYTLSVSVDIWSTNTDQKLQIVEPILQLFNPSLELQTTDNYLDWTSLTAVYFSGITWSSRTIPQGTESEIDITTIEFTVPIWIAPPAKVKRLGVITDIISRIHNSTIDAFDATQDIDFTLPEGDAHSDTPAFTDEEADAAETDLNFANRADDSSAGDGYGLERFVRSRTRADRSVEGSVISILKTTYQNIDLLVIKGKGTLVKNGTVGGIGWPEFLEAFPFKLEEGVSVLKLKRADRNSEIVGSFAIDPQEPESVTIDWDIDSLPTDTVIEGPNGDRSKIDYIIDPRKFNPQDLDLSQNPRILVLDDIGSDDIDAWKNLDNSQFSANANDIIEWSGTEWQVVLDSENVDDTVFATNLNTGIQYKFEDGEWLLSFEGEYPNGTWWIDF
jgi:hypothetical protein